MSFIQRFHCIHTVHQDKTNKQTNTHMLTLVGAPLADCHEQTEPYLFWPELCSDETSCERPNQTLKHARIKM